MTIKRDAEDLEAGVVIKAERLAGDDLVDADELEEMEDDKDIVYPSGHTDNAMTLNGVFPDYDPDA